MLDDDSRMGGVVTYLIMLSGKYDRMILKEPYCLAPVNVGLLFSIPSPYMLYATHCYSTGSSRSLSGSKFKLMEQLTGTPQGQHTA